MKKAPLTATLLALAAALTLTACAGTPDPTPEDAPAPEGTFIDLSALTVNGAPISADSTDAVYAANDIIYYEAGRDFTYGEGTEADAHTAEEAASHTVIHITRPGTYTLSGKLPAGQIAVDLGEDAQEDPEAVVTLVLDRAEITCTVAPAVIFYNVYECGDKDTPTKDVDTSAAGANVIIADGSTSTVNGAYVARIYKPESVVLNEEGTEVEDAKKLHKYDAAFYSRMSMNVTGSEEGSGDLYINAENEGLDSELHLTINGGNIHIASGNDGINTNEDGVSVTTVNGGNLTIVVTGETGEGDGIDSNGWLVINGGSVVAAACSSSMDSGIDSDMGIHINGGFVMASGHMLDRIEDGGQTYAVFNFAQTQTGGTEYTLKSADGHMPAAYAPANDFSSLLISGADLTAGDYTLWNGDVQLAHSGSMMGGFGGIMPPAWNGEPGAMPRPEDFVPGETGKRPEGFTPPEGMEPPEDFSPPDNFDLPENAQRPEGRPQPPESNTGNHSPNSQANASAEPDTVFTIIDGGNLFGGITAEK